MSEASKNARRANIAKAKRLTSGSGPGKVDASSWTPSAPMKADKKTGMRPVSPRTYKHGGKVQGDRGPKRADKAPRGNLANEISTRDTKQANRDKFGSPHIGGMKKGGKAKRADGGEIPVKQIDTMGASPAEIVRARPPRVGNPRPSSNGQGPSMGGRVAGSYGGKGDWKRGGKAKQSGGPVDRTPYEDAPPPRRAIPGDAPTRGPDPKGGGRATGHKYDSIDALIRDKGLKKGGKARKGEGGAMGRRINDTLNDNRSLKDYSYEIDAERRAPRALSPPFIRDRTDRSDPRALRDLQRGDADAMIGVNSRESGYKKGGKAHSDAAQDKAMIKKMVKPSAVKRDAKCGGGRMADGGAVDTRAPVSKEVARKRLYRRYDEQARKYPKMADIDRDAYVRQNTKAVMRTGLNDYADPSDNDPSGKQRGGSVAGGERPEGGRIPRARGGSAEDKPRARGGRLSGENFEGLKKAINAKGGIKQGASMRERWDALHGSGYSTKPLYDAGLNDDHIDTALRNIAGSSDGRTERASGGRTKGKTNINIVVNPAKPDQNTMPPSGPVRPPMAPPPPPPAPPMAPPPGAPPPNMPPPSMMAGAGGPPPMRARGGRLGMNKIGGSGGGLGRLEKANLR